MSVQIPLFLCGLLTDQRLYLGHLDLLDDYIRRDAFFLNRASRRREVASNRQLERAAIFQLDDRLHRAFAKRLCAHHHGTPVILQRPGHDLCR